MIFQRPQTAHHSAMFSGRGSGRWCCPLACLAPCSMAHLQIYQGITNWHEDGVFLMNMCGTIRVRPSQLCTNRSYFLFHQNTFRFGCRPPNYLFAHQSVLAIVHSTRPMLRIPCRNTETLVWLCEAVILLGLVQESLVQYDNYDGMPPAESTSPHYASN